MILGGEIQKIPMFLSLISEKAVPTVITAGKVGGTVMVTKSNDLSTISSGRNSKSSMALMEAQKPMTAKKAKTHM